MSGTSRKYELKKCDKRWFTLKKIEGETEVRYCDGCAKTIHWCNTEEQVKEAVANKWCIGSENRLLFTNLPPESKDAHSSGWLGEACIDSYQVEGETRNYIKDLDQ